MKSLEKIILGLLALLLIVSYPVTSNIPVFTATVYTVLVGCLMFYLGAFRGAFLLKQRAYRSFLLKIIPLFAAFYFIAVLLNVYYWISFSENASFQWRYMLEAFPHKESALLPVLFALGLFYGYLRTNMKAVRITIVGLVVLTISGMAYISLPYFNSFSEDAPYKVIQEDFSSIESLVKQAPFKDKTVYVDLWYSNCTPCIKQFREYLPSLKSEIVENGLEVEYLYLARETSHEDSKVRWKNAVEKYDLKGWHYYFSKEQAPEIWKEIKPYLPADHLTGYPHYLLARNGKIISYNAPKPEDSEDLIKLLTP